ncbi:hypothetical protein ACWJJH_11395 [Endozoicomonadaceae bacterium StTr2]
MRDNNEGMIEFLGATEVDGQYFAQIAIPVDKIRYYQFGVQKAGYNTVKRILQLRPFDQTPGVEYRYYWSGECRDSGGEFSIGVRCELGRKCKSVRTKSQELFAYNLLWFSQRESPSEIEHMEIEKPPEKKFCLSGGCC